MANEKKQQNGIRKPGNFSKVVSSGRGVLSIFNNKPDEPFNANPIKSAGTNGKGKFTTNVDAVKENYDYQKLHFDGIRVENKEIILKEVEIKSNEDEFILLYDNRLKEIAQAYKKGKDGKLQRVDADEFIIKPEIEGNTLKERVSVIDNILTKFLLEGYFSKNKTLKNAITEAINNSMGNLTAQKVDPEKISTLRDKIIFEKEVISKLDLNNPEVKNFYMELREEYNMPSLKQLKDKKFLDKAFTLTGTMGVSLKDFRKLTKTKEMLDSNKYITLTDIDEFNEIQKLKEESNIETVVFNSNTRYIGLDDTGSPIVFENYAIDIPSNGQIYKDYKLAEMMKDQNYALRTLKDAAYNPDKTQKEDVVKAENILKEKVSEFLDKETDNTLKKGINNLLKTVDVNQLYSVNEQEKKDMVHKFQSLHNYAAKKTYAQVEHEVFSEMDILTKDKTRIKHKKGVFRPVENKGFDKSKLENPDDAKTFKEYIMQIPNLSLTSWEQDIYENEKNTIGFSVHAKIDNKGIKIHQINNGAYIGSFFPEINLGKMIDNVRNYKEGEEKTTQKFKDIHNGIMKYFYLNKDEKSIKTSENFKKTIELIKPELSKLVELLKEKKYNEAKELVISWDNSEDKNIKNFAKWSENIGKNYAELKMFAKVRTALNLKDEDAREKVVAYLTNPSEETLQNIIEDDETKEYRQALTQFLAKTTTVINTISYQEEEYMKELHDLNGGVDEKLLQSYSLSKIVTNLAFDETNVLNIYYYDKNKKEAVILNTLDKNYSYKVGDEKFITYDKEVEINGKKFTVANLHTDELDKHIEKVNKIKEDVKQTIYASFKNLLSKANETLSFTNKKDLAGSNVTASFGSDFKKNTDKNININVDKKTELPKNEAKEQIHTIDLTKDMEPEDDIVDEEEIVNKEKVTEEFQKEIEETKKITEEEEIPLNDDDLDIPDENLDGGKVAAEEEIKIEKHTISFSRAKL